jgi:predicted oxidoreductase (fatty acid repression mutant protein)
MGVTAEAQNAFLTWFSQWGQVVYIFTQMAFWAAVATAAIIAALQYRRYVTHAVGGAPKTPASADKKASAKVSIDT